MNEDPTPPPPSQPAPPASTSGESRPYYGGQGGDRRRGYHRGRWHRHRRHHHHHGDQQPSTPEPPIDRLNMDEWAALPLPELRKKAEELGVTVKGLEPVQILKQALKLHAEKQNLTLVDGILESSSRGGSAFLRMPSRNYQTAFQDPYVSPTLIREFGLRPGDQITGMTRPIRERERHGSLASVDLLWDKPPSQMKTRKTYDELTPLFPNKRIVLETEKSVSMRALDLLAPLGRGQRCLIVAPPRAGKTIVLHQIAESIAKNDPESKVIMLLLDERPEEVYNARSIVKGEVVASTFDEEIEHHVRLADLIFEKVHRMVENGQHVVLLLDSLTRMARACNALSSGKGRLMSGGVEASALTKPRKFFSSARNTEEGGSLTIVATVLVETGSRMDDLIFEEFKGTGNMEIYLSRDLQERRIYPAIHIEKSGTRREDLLYHPDELTRISALRKQLSEYPPLEAMEKLIEQLKATSSNAELLMRLKL